MVLLAFANDKTEGGKFLRKLKDEEEEIWNACEKARTAHRVDIHTLTNATRQNIPKRFKDGEIEGRIVVFHYAGHANATTLLL